VFAKVLILTASLGQWNFRYSLAMSGNIMINNSGHVERFSNYLQISFLANLILELWEKNSMATEKT
jgi:hypothetical protein